ncbi:Histone-lysine N-methyltransferase SMYD3 [Pleurostoma richardsiae]|uniref:Histone-lysine N-methyltransferase SMYD3 n=1 Tax=Pleurostoma richardsiae TaxID=41990 RepID=A0AA38R7K2_9PEZI|nr:Histone-lysine N-methyltransferase SMYD3 [Pleurostoma richardsiae]
METQDKAKRQPEPTRELDMEESTHKKPRLPIHERPQLCDFILSKIAHKTVPLCIGRSHIEGAGSGLFVTEDVAEGEEILRSRPLILCRESGVDDVCDWCFTNRNSSVHPEGRFYSGDEDPRPIISRCARCKVARYCSTNCQKMAWANHHKFECSSLLSQPNTPSACLATQRILHWYEKGVLSAAEMGALIALETQFAARKATEIGNSKDDGGEDNPDCFDLATEAQRQVRTSLAFQPIWGLQCMVLTNIFSIRPAEKELTYGTCLDLPSSLLNHSCLQNAYVFIEGRDVRVRTLRPLHAGDEITVSYVDPGIGVIDRRDKLRNTFFIDCKCPKCRVEMAENLKQAINTGTRLTDLQQAQTELERRSYEAQQAYFDVYPRNIEVVYKFEKVVQAVAQRVFPEGEWPDHLAPMPHVLKNLSHLYEGSSHVSHLRYLVRGTLYRRTQAGPAWVHDMLFLVISLIRTSQHPDDLAIWAVSAFPTRSELRTIARGYLVRLCLDARMAFGFDTKYVKALYVFAGKMLEYKGDPAIATAAFERSFNTGQARLRGWVGMDEPASEVALPPDNQVAMLVGDVKRLQ